MSHRWKPIVACIGLLLLASVSGCGGGDSDKSPKAAIDGTGKDNPSEAGTPSPANPKSNANLKHPVVVIDTSLGKITVELDAEKAQLTVDNFLRYVNASFYDQTIIHQVVKGQGIVAGGYGANLVAKPTRQPVRNEADNKVKNARGTIAMARLLTDTDSATSQFFINVVDNPLLDHKGRKPEEFGYCVFGKVIDGMPIVDQIAALDTVDTKELAQMPKEKVVVNSIRLIR